MNKLKFYLLLGLVNVLFFGCTSDDDPQPADDSSDYFMEATIDGKAWKSIIGGFFGGAVLEVGSELTTIAGYGTDNNSQLVILLPMDVSSIEEKSYSINSLFGPDDDVHANYSPTFFSSNGLGITYYTTTSSGTLTITKYDKQNEVVEGTFEFTAEATDANDNVIGRTTITAGKFKLPIE